MRSSFFHANKIIATFVILIDFVIPSLLHPVLRWHLPVSPVHWTVWCLIVWLWSRLWWVLWHSFAHLLLLSLIHNRGYFLCQQMYLCSASSEMMNFSNHWTAVIISPGHAEAHCYGFFSWSKFSVVPILLMNVWLKLFGHVVATICPTMTAVSANQ